MVDEAMDIANLLQKDTVLLSLDVQDKEECIDKLAEKMLENGFLSDKQSYIEAVLTREKSGTTGVGFGVSIPHGKSRGVVKPGLAFAHLNSPVDWNSFDNKPVELVFLIAVPEENAGNEHLKILTTIARKIMHEDFRDQLSKARSYEEILALFADI
jgi:PTS system fructose-specific IIA component